MKKLSAVAFLLLLFTAAFGAVIEMQNEFIKIRLDDNTGRFSLENLTGLASTTADDNKNLLYKKDPPTTLASVIIDGEVFIFGSTAGNYRRRGTNDNGRLVTEWTVRGISVIQELGFIKGAVTGQPDTMFVLYRVKNENSRTAKVGVRLLLDTVVGNTKPKSFLLNNGQVITTEREFSGADIPAWWYITDDPSDPKVQAAGILTGRGTVRPDRVIFGAWDRFYDNLWEYRSDTSRDFKRKEGGGTDSAVAVYFNEANVGPQETILLSTLYGNYEMLSFTPADLSLAVQLPASTRASVVPVTAVLSNSGRQEFSALKMELTYPDKFILETGETNIVDLGRVAPGDSRISLWNIKARGDIEGEYPITVRAVAWVGASSNAVIDERTFAISYQGTISLTGSNQAVVALAPVTNTPPAVTNEPVIITPAVTNIPAPLTNAVVVVPPPETNAVQPVMTNLPPVTPVVQVTNVVLASTNQAPTNRTLYSASDRERKILSEIEELNTLIEQINNRYQVLMGVYRNSLATNTAYLQELEYEIIYFENKLKQQEESLAAEKEFLR